MPTDTTEKRRARHKLIVEARAILDKAEEETRSLTAEDRTQYDKIMAAANTAKVEIEDVERRNDLEREEHAAANRQREEEDRRKAEDEEQRGGEPPGPLATEEYRSGFGKWLGGRSRTPEEERALSAGTGTEGGFLYASEQFSTQLIADVTDATILRQICNVLPPLPTADSLGIPTLTDRMSDAEWTSELGVPSEDTTLAVGKRALTPHPLAKEVKISKVLRRKLPTIDAFVRGELARVAAEAMENGYLTGDGSQKALGMFVASSDGIPTARDVSTGNAATSPTFDGLKAAKYEIKQVYWRNLKWIFHRDVMEVISKLKDGNGRYLLQDSVVQGDPDRLLGFPALMSEFAPNTLTASQYVGILGDFDNYWIVDSLAVQIQVAEELYMRQNQDLFVMRAESDGAPVRSEAFARVKLGT